MLPNSHLRPTQAPNCNSDDHESGLFTVLIVDSDLHYRTTVNASFLRHGWQVKTAACLREAFRAIDQQIFDLVLCDLQMRDGDVYQVMVALEECAPGTPVIVLAANAGAPDVVKAMRNGAADFLVKDVSFDILQMAARTAVKDGVRRPFSHTEESLEATTPAPAMTLSALNRMHLEAALTLVEGNRTNAAKVLGISVRTVRNKIREYGLPPRRQT